ncbi:hypothetical protein BH20VER2_BH20VER2_16160 [soil metagenome]
MDDLTPMEDVKGGRKPLYDLKERTREIDGSIQPL